MAVTIKGTEGVSKVEATGTPSSSTFLRGDYAWAAIPAGASLSTASGSAPSYSARAWVNFNGTGTVAIRASGNVSSITDNGTGDYTVNFTAAMVDVNYATVGGGYQITSHPNTSFAISSSSPGASTSAVRVNFGTTGGANSAGFNRDSAATIASIAIFR